MDYKALSQYNAEFTKKLDVTADNVTKKLAARRKKGKEGRYVGTTRWFGSMASCMYLLDKVSEPESKRMYEALSVDEKKSSGYELNQKARAYDQIFNAVLSFDLRSVSLNSPADTLDKGMMDLRLMSQLMFDFHREEFEQYERLIDNPKVKCALNKEQLKEVKARWSLLQSINSLVSVYPQIADAAHKNKIDLDGILEKDIVELVTLANLSKNEALKEAYGAAFSIKGTMDTAGFKFGDDLEKVLENIRKNEFKLPESHENLDLAKEKLEARLSIASGEDMELYKPEEDSKPEGLKAQESKTPLTDELNRIYEKIDFEFEDSGLSAKKIQAIKDRQKDFFEYNRSVRFNADKNLIVSLAKDPSVDARGLAFLLRPVKVDEQGKPLTKKDEENLWLNNEELRSLAVEPEGGLLKDGKTVTRNLSDRKEFLDRVANEAAELAFTYKELNNPAFIVRNKERAIRHLSFFNSLLNLYHSHAGYYQTAADASVRGTLYNLLEATDYVNYSAFRIQQALMTDGMGAEGLQTGGSTMAGTAHIPYMRGYDYKTIMAENKMIAKDLNYLQATEYARYYTSDVRKLKKPDGRALSLSKNNNRFMEANTPFGEYIELREKYGSKKKIFTGQQREELIKSTLDELFKNKGKKKYNDKIDGKIDRLRRLDKTGRLTSNNKCLRNDIYY